MCGWVYDKIEAPKYAIGRPNSKKKIPTGNESIENKISGIASATRKALDNFFLSGVLSILKYTLSLNFEVSINMGH